MKAINITDIGCSVTGPAGLSGVSLLALPLTGSNAELLGVYLCWAYNTFSTEQVSLRRQTLTVGRSRSRMRCAAREVRRRRIGRRRRDDVCTVVVRTFLRGIFD